MDDLQSTGDLQPKEDLQPIQDSRALRDLRRAMAALAEKKLADGTAARALAWREGALPHLAEPAFFSRGDELGDMTYGGHCRANLSGLLAGAGAGTLAFLRPCDARGYAAMLGENRAGRAGAHIVGIGCPGVFAFGNGSGNARLEAACAACGHGHPDGLCDELLGAHVRPPSRPEGRFDGVEAIEGMAPDARRAFWQGELGRCVRCNACRNICPVCGCKKCVFDSEKYDSRQTVSASESEERMFHIVRAYHVAGRCTDCGQCSLACPQKIPLHLLNRKHIKDIGAFFGARADGRSPLASISPEEAAGDPEPGAAKRRDGQ